MKKTVCFIIVLTIVTMGLCACGGEGSGARRQTENKVKDHGRSQVEGGSGDKRHAEITIRDYGTIQVELDADTAPITVENFENLVNQKFYDGLTFHRIISGFMIQGGDPKGTGTGGSGETIKGEFSSNGVENNISHKRGVISMARSSDKDSASSQFFIMQQDGFHLDGDYAAFGKVTKGIEVVDRICQMVEVIDENGTVEKANQPVIESIKMLD